AGGGRGARGHDPVVRHVPHRALGELPRRPLPGRLRRQGRCALMARSSRRIIAAPPEAGPLLVVADFRTHFRPPAGVVKAVDGVSLTLDRGRTLGIVGESGSGKTVLSRSIMGLLTAGNVVRTGSVRLNGQELVGASNAEMRALWGTEMAMVFQDPMTSLNPVM